MINPTVGRIVWFWSGPFRPGPNYSGPNPEDQPLAAIVTHVWSDVCVNLSVCDPNGNWHGVTSVRLLQDEDLKPEEGYYAEWMPEAKSDGREG